jgi:transmembrane sensor
MHVRDGEGMSESSEQIEQAAAEWLAKKDGSGWETSDEAALITWLEASTARRVAYIRIAEAWRRSQQLGGLRAKLPR